MALALFSLSTWCSIIGLKRSVYYEKRSSSGDEEKQKAKLEKETQTIRYVTQSLMNGLNTIPMATLRCLSIYLDRVSHGLQNLL